MSTDPTAKEAGLEDADPVAVLLAWLQQSDEAADALGGPDRASGIPEAPWPHLMLDHGPGGDLGAMRWVTSPEVILDLRGHPGGWPGKAELRRILVRLVKAAQAIVEAPHVPGRPVVNKVAPSGLLVWAPLIDGQPRWLITLGVTLHP
ncbi:hypothetical protein ABZV65_30995 [Streptomyces bauhiniae]|uniref:hypothetical protein n=1 Tax=Streptomyces bauhiniae TaxID=2340725 RepID=UPI0033BF2758